MCSQLWPEQPAPTQRSCLTHLPLLAGHGRDGARALAAASILPGVGERMCHITSGQTLPARAVTEFTLLVQPLGRSPWLGYCCKASVPLHALARKLFLRCCCHSR
jgi:hypothetical protein